MTTNINLKNKSGMIKKMANNMLCKINLHRLKKKTLKFKAL